MAKDPYRYFRIEARELMDQLAKGALDLEKHDASTDTVLRLLRLAHTLKGAARVVKQAQIADLVHGVEDLLSPHRDGTAAVPRERVDQVLAALDAINALLAQLAASDDSTASGTAPNATHGAAHQAANNAGADTSAGQPAPQQAAPFEAVRVARADVVEIDVLLEGLGEIGSALAGVRGTVHDLKALRELSAQLNAQVGAQAGTQLGERVDSSHARTRALAAQALAASAAAERSLAATAESLDRELKQARDIAQRLRLVPASSIFHTLERAARDAAHGVGKQVVFEAQGGELRLDAEVLDTVQSALVQLVRNAVAHGIESPQERQAQGKPPTGRIKLSVKRHGYAAWFRCTDDGRGVDLEAVRRALLHKGLAPEQTQALDAAQLLTQLLKGGISTANTVTELSGRGVGLDVVRDAMQRLNGEAHATSQAGGGTAMELRVPLSLAALNVLFVESDAQLAAIPLDAVQRTVRITASDWVHTPQGTAIADQGALIPLVPLALAHHGNGGGNAVGSASGAGHARRNPSSLQTAVIVHAAGKTVALGVTRLRGIDTVVLRPLPALLPAQNLVLGLHLDADGNPCIVVNPEHCVTLQAVPTDSTAAAPSTAPILIIDDSLTTRMLESSILESAGFAVEMATSAEEGLVMAQAKTYALFLVDVEMPGMDGFGFVAQTRVDPVLREVPCILVSSRDAPEDRQRGLVAGASAYIVKGEFDQGEFLQRVAELVAL